MRLDDLAIEWWGKSGEAALRRSAFKEAIAHLGKAIAMADKAKRGGSKEGAANPAFSGRLLKLHTDYGHAVMWSKGFAAAETSAAYARVGDLASQPAAAPSETSSTRRSGLRPSFAVISTWLASKLKHSCAKRKLRGARWTRLRRTVLWG